MPSRASVWVQCALGAALLAAAVPAPAADSDPVDAAAQPLVSQAHYWEDRGRYDLARETWLKLLRLRPQSTEALVGLAMSEARSNRPAAAQVYLDRLRETHPDHPEIARIEAAVQQGSIDQSKLELPRGLARQGRYQAAIDAYRELFGGTVPGGRLGLEYYQTLAGVDGQWETAREGIAELARDNPKEPLYELALAQHLTYREATRREGVRQLQRLSETPALASQTRQAWRQALIWLSTDPSDRAYYQAFLDRYGADPEIQTKLDDVKAAVVAATPSVNPRVAKVQAAYDALNDGELDLAEQRFKQLLADDARDSDGLGGLGLVRLRQEQFGEAAALLEQASVADPARARRWREALGSARFYSLLHEAQAARDAGELPRAERLLRDAIASGGVDDLSDVRSTLADLLAEQEKTAEAESLYNQVLAADPGNLNAVRGLVGLYARDGRIDQALALADKLPPAQREEIASLGQLRALSLRDQAADHSDPRQKEDLLKQALLLDPSNVWVRLDLANLYLEQKRTREANTLVDGILAGKPNMGDALFVKALLLSQQSRWYEALQLLEQIPAASRDAGKRQLQKRLWVRYQTERAAVYARYGRTQDAQAILSQVSPLVRDEPELLGALAGAYAEVGDESQALGYIRDALARSPNPDPGLRMQYAALLFKLQQDTEFEVVVEDLARRDDLSRQQSLDLANLRVAYRLRQADLVREEGDLARAYEYLSPLLRVNPNDPRVLMALARLYDDSQEYERSTEIYARVLQMDGENLDAYKGAIGAALARQEWLRAETLLNRAFELDPENPRLYAMAGRLARARGEEGRALELYQRALALDAEQGASEFGGRYAPQLYLLESGAAPDPDFLPVPGYGGSRYPSSPSSLQERPPAASGAYERRAAWRRGADGGRLIKVGAPRREPPASSIDAGIRPSIYALEAEAPAPPPPSDGAVRDEPFFFLRLSTESDGERVSESAETVWTLPRPETMRMDYSPLNSPARLDHDAERLFPPPKLDRRPTYQRPSLATMPAPLPALPASPPQEARAAPPASAALAPMPQYSPPPVTPPPSAPSLQRIDPLSSLPTPRVHDPLTLKDLPPVEGLRMTPQMAYSNGDPALRGEVEREWAEMRSASAGSRSAPAATSYVRTPQKAPTRERANLLQEIAAIEAQRSGYAGIGVSFRNRDGQNGLGRLLDIELPIEAGVAGGDAGRFSLRVVPVILDAGTVSGTDIYDFGAMALVDDAEGYRFGQDASGVAVGGAYSIGSLRLDVGSSPLGFPVETIVGGLRWAPQVGNMSLTLNLSRRSVTDSLLSYAGTYDPASGRTWGGVSRTGGRVDLAFDLGQYGVYANGSYHVYNGENLEDNSGFEGGGGFYVRGISRPGLNLTYGVNLTTFFYDKNRRHFTLGHGGYFSPQFYMSLGIPFEVTGARERLSYRIAGAIGLQAFREDDALYYPNDSGLQSSLTELAADEDNDLETVYEGNSQSGVGYNFNAAVEYLVAPRLSIGGLMSLDNAKDFNESLAFGYVRYWFSAQPRVASPPNPIRPYFSYGGQ